MAVLLWEDFMARSAESKFTDDDPAFATLRNQQHTIAIPRRFGSFAKETWMTQDRLIKRNPRTIGRLIQHKRFRAGFDFLCLRAETETDLAESAKWWTTFQEQDEAAQQDSGSPTCQNRNARDVAATNAAAQSELPRECSRQLSDTNG